MLLHVNVEHQVRAVRTLLAQADATSVAHARGDADLDRARCFALELKRQLSLCAAHGIGEWDGDLGRDVGVFGAFARPAAGRTATATAEEILERAGPCRSASASSDLLEQIFETAESAASESAASESCASHGTRACSATTALAVSRVLAVGIGVKSFAKSYFSKFIV
jgi:hypothetical protein